MTTTDTDLFEPTSQRLDLHGIRYTWYRDRNHTHDVMLHWYWLFTPATATILRAVNPDNPDSMWMWNIMVPETSGQGRKIQFKGKPFRTLEKGAKLTKIEAFRQVTRTLEAMSEDTILWGPL